MMIKRFYRSLFLLAASLSITLPAVAQNPYGQVLQINTHFHSVFSNPTWLLIIRNIESGEILPYVFDIRNNDNFWIAFTKGRSYRVTASVMTFGSSARINNFCGLEDGILLGKSMIITLSGNLMPAPGGVKCHINQFADTYFTVVNGENENL